MSVSDNTLIEQDCASQQIARAIGLFMGAGRKYSVADVSLGTNIPSRTLSGYIAPRDEVVASIRAARDAMRKSETSL
jgi:hypothetical protein